ncbi:MAG: penicillin-binding protein 1A [Thiotrichaceae bacterium]|nr:penicillin-binding protein 1A [Thiotrichaceae bacterium]
MSIRQHIYLSLRVITYMLVVIGVLAASGIAIVYWHFMPQLPSIDTLKEVKFQVPLRIYSQDNALIAEFGEQRRIPLGAKDMPALLLKAVLAAEDDRFYEHNGVDVRSLMRAGVSLLRTGEKSQGGSTITMQVARNLFLDSKKNYTRKIKEILLALKIEDELSKEEILQLYLNQIFFGHRAYGVGAAAQVYYGKTIQELSLAEYATLAGLPKAPSTNNPLSNPERAMERRNYILRRMLELKYIDNEQFQSASIAPNTAKLYSANVELDSPYIAEMVRSFMIEKYGEERTYNSGYRVYTTVDSHLQLAAQKSLRNALWSYDERHGYHGAREKVKIPIGLKDKELASFAAEVLAKHPVAGGMLPALITEVKERKATAYTLQHGNIEIAWEEMSWARPYIDEDRAGGAPRNANDVVKRGDVVMLRPMLRTATAAKKKAAPTPPPTEDDDYVPPEEVPVGVQQVQRWRLAEIPKVEGALVSLRPDDGALVALSGGFDFYLSKFNRVTQAERQPGSNFKPFVYSAALEYGFNAASVIVDEPISVDVGSTVWEPENYGRRFYGPTTFRKALTYSRNIVSIRILDSIGIDEAIDHAVLFGFKEDKLPTNLTLALGTGEVTPWELVNSYAVFANGGYKVDSYFVQRIEDVAGNVIFQSNPARVCHECDNDVISPTPVATPVSNKKTNNKKSEKPVVPPTPVATLQATEANNPNAAIHAKRVIRAQNIWVMNSVLRDVVKFGTAQRALKLHRTDIAGKTGTTNDQKDAWFSGYTPDVVTTTWVGFDQPQSLGEKETGGRSALPMWIEFMTEALKDKPERPLPQPTGLISAKVDPETGAVIKGRRNDAVLETFFEEDNVERKPKHSANKVRSREPAERTPESNTANGSPSETNTSAPPPAATKHSLVPDNLF